MNFKLTAAIAIGALTLAGCATPPPPDPLLWTRTDGQKITGNAALEQQDQIDEAICKGEGQKSAVVIAPIYYSGLAGAIRAAQIQNEHRESLTDIVKGCMAQHGYIAVPASQADQVREEFAKTAKVKPKQAAR